jgi:hypothetical protein
MKRCLVRKEGRRPKARAGAAAMTLVMKLGEKPRMKDAE